jgi:hypothetical protein
MAAKALAVAVALLALSGSSHGGSSLSLGGPASHLRHDSSPPPAPTSDADAPCVWVRDHGARGDGVADDTDAIQAAVNAAIDVNRETTALHYPRGSATRIQEDDTGPALCFGPG